FVSRILTGRRYCYCNDEDLKPLGSLPMRTTLFLALAVALSTANLNAISAQPKAPAPKLNPAKIQAAEAALAKHGCQVERVTDPKSPLFKHVKLVNFPDKTTDADFTKLVPQLTALPALTVVDLGGTKITDKSGVELAKLPALEAIYLDRTII